MEKQDLIVTYGTDAAAMTRQVLDKADLASMISDGNAKIGIKPNLVVAKPHNSGATTSPVMVEAVLRYLREHGFKQLLILEGSWVGDSTKKAFSVSGIEEAAEKYGVPLLDTKDDAYCRVQAGPMEMEISKTALDLDFIINMPVLKGHCQTKITGALKNLKGCMSDREKRHFHLLGLHRPIAYLNTVLKSGFILMDGLCGDLDFEEGGNPVPMNQIIGGVDPVLVDSYVAEAMGYSPEEIEYIKIAHELGVGSCDIIHANRIVLHHDHVPVRPLYSRKVQLLSQAIVEKEACSACYANLIQALARLQDKHLLVHFKQQPIFIGQGFKGKTGDGVGCGACTQGFRCSVPGCPPAATTILHVLLQEIGRKSAFPF